MATKQNYLQLCEVEVYSRGNTPLSAKDPLPLHYIGALCACCLQIQFMSVEKAADWRQISSGERRFFTFEDMSRHAPEYHRQLQCVQ